MYTGSYKLVSSTKRLLRHADFYTREKQLVARAIAVRTLIQASVAAAVVLLVMLLLNATHVLLAIFGGVLIAVLFHGTAKYMGACHFPCRTGHGCGWWRQTYRSRRRNWRRECRKRCRNCRSKSGNTNGQID